jgi:Flp pilus assembly protein TadG
MKALQHSRLWRVPAARQRGAAAVEFALVALVFFTLLLGIMEFGRWMFTLNAAREATRLGARLAVVCSQSDAALISQRMSELTVSISPEQMVIDYFPASCTADNCRTVTARVQQAEFRPLIPFLGGGYAIPPFPVSMPRESMNSSQNRVCPSHPDYQ